MHDFDFVVHVGVAEQDFHHEAVELRLGHRVGALLLDRILGSQDEEGIWQGVGVAAGRELAFFHGLEQGTLGLRRGAIDLVGENDVAEQRTFDESKVAVTRGDVFLEDVGTGDVSGHQVGSELNASKLKLSHRRERRDQLGFCQAGNAFKDGVAAADQGNEYLLDRLVHADDDVGKLIAEIEEGVVQAADGGDFIRVGIGGATRGEGRTFGGGCRGRRQGQAFGGRVGGGNRWGGH